MSSSSGSNKEAIDLQKRSLALQEQQGNRQLEFLAMQARALQQVQVAPYKQQSPPPTASTAGVDYAAAQEAIAASRRFGYAKSVRGGMKGGIAA